MKQKNKQKNFKRGFTLLELLVVVLIIGILAAIALPKYQHIVDKAKFTQLLITVKAFKDAQIRYMLLNNDYSSDLRVLDISLEGVAMNKSEFKTDSGHCFLLEGGSFYCLLNSPKVSYKMYFGSEARQCIAYEAYIERSSRLCESVLPNATKQHHGSGYCSEPCTVYTSY